MTKIIVKSFEEELGSELFVVTSETKTKEEILKCCRIAEKYAGMCWDDIEEQKPDEHWKTMVEWREGCNGIETFNAYLEEFCECKVEPLEYDFAYEW